MPGLRAIADALEERTGLRAAWRWLADEDVRGGARWAYVLGSVLLALVAWQALSGIALAFDYAPTAAAAHASVSRIMDPAELPWGRLVRGLHHHGASFLVVIAVLHALQVATFGAGRRPREANWLTGLGLFALVLAFAFTGYLLPWDQTAYYATRVGLGILRSTPVAGPTLADLLQGGPTLGNLTLTRFFVLHVVVLPAAFAGLALLHLALFRRHGVTAPSARPAHGEPFWPHQAARDAVAILVATAALVVVARLVPAPLEARADPTVPFEARPEWYFYWLFQLLRMFEPPVEWIATLVIPGGIALFLVLFPWLDGWAVQRPHRRRGPLAALVAIVVAVACLTAWVAVTDAPAVAAGEGDAADVRVAVAGVTPVQAGMLYGEKCTECHARDGSAVDPDARDFRTPDFARMAKADFGGLVRIVKEGDENGIMPPFEDELTDAEIRAILEHVVLRFPARSGAE